MMAPCLVSFKVMTSILGILYMHSQRRELKKPQ